MKITGGQARGLRIETPAGSRTRPSTDRMRESVFAILRDLVQEARVLDLFAGSGALGLEAASRGAREVRFVEQHAPTAALIRGNAARLAPAGVACSFHVHSAEASAFLRSPVTEPFDLIFADPPYNRLSDASALHGLLDLVSAGPWLSADGLLVLECDQRLAAPLPPDWRLLRSESYGGTSVWFLDAPTPGDA